MAQKLLDLGSQHTEQFFRETYRILGIGVMNHASAVLDAMSYVTETAGVSHDIPRSEGGGDSGRRLEGHRM
ncbi:hypothetical protein [Sphaerimonospora thailandensis]|uniref:Uncharacterized protein n=1 Tax=Sphaerimonospora thailandensis TaxID=795644 RepID=A0A8J3R623_9ACTN|nr:hypothetical protein [Sphaerimonospora thailandensis]GIH68654.1 hypothetical protein Mth01_09070 [Sphaerimonospora thailandensis]